MILIAFALFHLGFAANATDTPLAPNDFLNFQAIELKGEGAVYRLDLPEAVYSKVHFDDLRDLRLFNAQDEVVPHTFQLHSPVETRTSRIQPLVSFPIDGQQDAIDGSSEITLTEGNDRTVSVRLKGKKASPKDARIGYLVDLRKQKQPLRALIVDWKSKRKNEIISIDVTASDDLRTWRPLASQMTLAHFAYEGQSLDANLVELPESRSNYLRITWSQDPSFEITKLDGEFVSADWTEAKRFETAVTATGQKGNEYEFQKSPTLTDRVAIELPQDNTIVRVMLSSASTPNGPWYERYSGTAFRVKRPEGLFTSGFQKAQASSDRYWKLQIEGREASLGKSSPTLKFGWSAHQLYFLARGPGPFRLAFGNAKAPHPDFGFHSLVEALPTREGKIEPVQATLVGEIQSNGVALKKAAEQSVEPIPWKKYALWASLIAALLLSTFMAWKLYRDLNKK